MSISKPRLYVYEHCPFCNRARFSLDMKQVDYDLVYLAHDDEATPIRLVNAKQLPILELPDGTVMAESMDIVKFVNDKLNGAAIFKQQERQEVVEWVQESFKFTRFVLIPRMHDSIFPEFAKELSRTYFREKKEKQIEMSLDEARKRSPENIAKLNAHLLKLEAILQADFTATGNELSLDDVNLFGYLRTVSLIKGVVFPPKVQNYLDNLSKKSGIRLLTTIAN